VNVAPPIINAIPGCIVTRVIVDDSFTLTLCGIDREIVLRIDGEGELQRDGGHTAFDPDRDPASVVSLIGLLNRRIDGVELADDGRLHLMTPGMRLSVLPSEHAVSWSIHGPDGTRASCIAEGKVVWE
jgi:hypothetical protein